MNCRGRRAVCTFGPLADALEAIYDADRLFVGFIVRVCSPREAPEYHLAPQAQRGRGPAIVVSPTPRQGQIRCGSQLARHGGSGRRLVTEAEKRTEKRPYPS